MSEGTRGASRRRRPERNVRLLLTRGAHLLILWTLAVAQPLFDLLRRNPEFFAIRGSPGLDIVVLAVGLAFGPPLVGLLLEGLAGLIDARLGLALHLVLVALLLAAIVLPVLERTGSDSSALLLPLALALGTAGTVAYARWRPARSFLTVLSPAAVLLVVLFLFFSPVTELVTGDEADAQLSRQTTEAPVVMVVLDELPLTSLLGADGRIDARRYPNFAALARDSYWFRNTAAVDAFTQIAVPAVLTGRRPKPDQLPNFADHPDNAFTLLGPGHRLNVEEAITRLCPEELCVGRSEPGFRERMGSLTSDLRVVSLHLLLPDDLSERLPSIDSSWQDFRDGPDLGDERQPDPGEFRSQLDRRIDTNSSGRGALADGFVARAGARGRDGRPPFDFLHLLLPHVPWQYLPDGSTYGQESDIPGLDDEVWADRPGVGDVAYQRHLLQLGLIDRLLGRLVRRLRSQGIYDEALVAVVADHGVSFRRGVPRRDPRSENAADLLSVPFFVKAPRQRQGRIVDTQLQTIDVLPTIAGLLGVRMPWRADGRSALAAGAERRSVTITSSGERPVTLSAPALRRGRAEALRRKLSLFGPGGGALDLYRFGTGRELVGRRAETLSRAAPGRRRASLNGGGALAAVERSSGFLPVHVTGRVSGGAVSRVALAVNGTIGAVVRPVSSGSSADFSGILPPQLLRQGSNLVEVFALEEGAGGPALASLARAGGGPAEYQVADGTIRGRDGSRFRIVEGRLEGFVDRTVVDDRIVEVAGWAATPRFGPVQRIVAFADDRLRFSGAPTTRRADVTAANGAPPADLGFGFELPRTAVPDRPSPVDVYALEGGIATRLPYYCGKGARQDVGC